MNLLQVNIIVKGTNGYEENDAHPNSFRLLNALQENLDKGDLSTLYVHCQESLDKIEHDIKKFYGEKITVRRGVQGGCYGARDGETYEGLTLWVSASLVPTRFVDKDGDEIINLIPHIEDCGGELVEDMDGDALAEVLQGLGIEAKRDNTYNYSGMDSETPSMLYNADFSVFEGTDAIYVCAKFHYGGDIRGNYSSTIVFKFNSIEDVFSAFCPTIELTEQEGA